MFAALDRFVNEAMTDALLATLPAWPRPNVYKVGAVGETSFVYTIDDDGHTELSIRRATGALTADRIAAFFRVAKIPLPTTLPTVISKGRGAS